MSIADAVTLRKAIDQRIETTSYANMTASEAKESKQTIFIEISQRLAFNHAVRPNRITQPDLRIVVQARRLATIKHTGFFVEKSCTT